MDDETLGFNPYNFAWIFALKSVPAYRKQIMFQDALQKRFNELHPNSVLYAPASNLQSELDGGVIEFPPRKPH